jgi:hypothetical protein
MTFEMAQLVVDLVRYEGITFLLRDEGKTGDRMYLQVEATTPCNVSGDVHTWKGRKWFISKHATKSEIVLTAFKALLTAQEHEAREKFLYRGRPILDPHYDVDALWNLRGMDPLDERPPMEKAVTP